MKYTKQLIALIFTSLVVGCTSNTTLIPNHDTDYLHAKSVPPLKIPPGLSSSTFQDHYPVPERNYPVSAQKVSLVPPGL